MREIYVDFALYWDRKETGRADAYLQLKAVSGEILGAVRVEECVLLIVAMCG